MPVTTSFDLPGRPPQAAHHRPAGRRSGGRRRAGGLRGRARPGRTLVPVRDGVRRRRLAVPPGRGERPGRPARTCPPASSGSTPTSGKVSEIGVEVLGGPRGSSYRDGAIYVTVKGGYHAHLDRYDLKTGERTVLVDGLPERRLARAERPGLRPGRADLLRQRLGQPERGVSAAGVHGRPRQAPGGVRRARAGRHAHRQQRLEPQSDHALPVPGRDRPVQAVRQAGREGRGHPRAAQVQQRALAVPPRRQRAGAARLGPAQPVRTGLQRGGRALRLGQRLRGEGRAVRSARTRTGSGTSAMSKTPHGSVTTPDWYGFPDICGDGLPAWHESHSSPARASPPSR